MHLLFTELDRASCSPFQMEEGETKFEMGYIQLATRLGVSVNNTCTMRMRKSGYRVFLMFSVMYAAFFMRAILIFYEGGVAQFRHGRAKTALPIPALFPTETMESLRQPSRSSLLLSALLCSVISV